MKQLHLNATNVISGRIVSQAAREGYTEIVLDGDAVVTSVAMDAAAVAGIILTRRGGTRRAGAPAAAASAFGSAAGADAVFSSAEARAFKDELVAAGRKLWRRAYVDGNGGNLSYRIGEKYVLCTPTLISKGDLTPDDICLVDLDGNQLAGRKKKTSEILLHLEIMKAQPKARACVHAHPPHATAYAITGMVPPVRIIPEAEIFVGHAGFAPYGTPGTKDIAEKIAELVSDHNTILLGNHGVVSWADSVTHAEWCIEVLDTYCQTLIIASQLSVPIKTIPADKTCALLETKRKMNLPDPRLSGRECTLADMPDNLPSITVCPGACDRGVGPCRLHDTATCPRAAGAQAQAPAPALGHENSETEALIGRIIDEVMKTLEK